MRLDKLTVKAQEALEAAGGIAGERDAAQVEPEHLLKALLGQADGIVRPVLAKVGADANALDAGVVAALAASVFHFREFSIKEVKQYLKQKGLQVNL